MIAGMVIETDEGVVIEVVGDDHDPDQGIVDEQEVQVVEQEVQAEAAVPLEEAGGAVHHETETTETDRAIDGLEEPQVVELEAEGRLLAVVVHQKSVVLLAVVVVLSLVLLPVPVAAVIPHLPLLPLPHLALAHEEKRRSKHTANKAH
jgi:hypothetical protein